jgi:2-dehydro-3-deoxyphosphooctonate aldolase (KDO 8-P synthase)
MKRTLNQITPRLLQRSSTSPFFLIAGPCVIESEQSTMRTAERLREMSDTLNIPIIFKASFDKANRQSSLSYRGPGLEKGLNVLDQVKNTFGPGTNGLLITTDCHEPYQANMISQVADIIQIPALLCRQTDLIESVANTGCMVNIKKGPFASPKTMLLAAEKVQKIQNELLYQHHDLENNINTINNQVILTERGTFFGYDDLVFDPRNLIRMRSNNTMIVQDVTHSVQTSNSKDGNHSSSGERNLIPTIARAATAVGVDGLFFETHENPNHAMCDGPNQWPIDRLEELISELIDIANVTNGKKYNDTVVDDDDDNVEVSNM